jgi:hypothetical protein
MNNKQKRSKAKNELVPVGNGGAPVLYQRMQAAIADCHSIDDCKRIATQASAIAAYYDQIQDDESVHPCAGLGHCPLFGRRTGHRS